jgi:FkbM family methyltransferase
MRRHGGLAWAPSFAPLNVEEQWFADHDFVDKVIYDVGAFHGLLTLHFARTARAVIAFEPLPAHCRIVERNVELNGLQSKVRVLPYGCGSINGRTKLIVDGLLPGTASAAPEIQRGMRGREVAIEIRTIDDLDLPPPDFVKIDIEGMELSALQGMERTLRSHRPELYIELHGATPAHKRDNARAVIAFLRNLGYRLRWLESRDDPVGDWERPSSHLIAMPAPLAT